MPLSTHSLDSFTNDRKSALLALGCSSFCAFGLASNAPSIPVLLDVAHSLFEWVSTFGAEEMSKVPVLSECNHMLPKNRSLAVFALGSIQLMPIEMAEVPKSSIAILCVRQAFNFGQRFAVIASLDSVQAFGAFSRRLFEYFKSFETSTASEAYEALRMVFLESSAKANYPAFNGQLTLLTGRSGSLSSRRPVSPR